MYLRSSDVGEPSKTCETVSTPGVCARPSFRILSERQTMEELSSPPLSSAKTGRSDLSRQHTASVNSERPCSVYCSLVLYLISLARSSLQYRSVDSFPCA